MEFHWKIKHKLIYAATVTLATIAPSRDNLHAQDHTGIMGTAPTISHKIPFRGYSDTTKIKELLLVFNVHDVCKKSYEKQYCTDKIFKYWNFLTFDLQSGDTVFLKQHILPFYNGDMTYTEFRKHLDKHLSDNDTNFYKIKYKTKKSHGEKNIHPKDIQTIQSASVQDLKSRGR